jgi:two-component system cell cycle sensor histidine kinase/response regulator CckA
MNTRVELMRAFEEIEDSEGMLRESLQMFRTTFDQAAVGIAHMDLEGNWIQVNNKLLEIVGYSHQELLESTFEEITHPEDVEATRERMERLLCGEVDEYSMEKRCVRKDGAQVWVNLNVSLVRHPSGEPSYLMAVIQDIDER